MSRQFAFVSAAILSLGRARVVGEKAGDKVEITSGLAQAETLVVDPRGRITDGMPVKTN